MAEDRAVDRPNILLILADDLGYSDLSCYGSEIDTPNLDALAATGLRYTQFYNTTRCWPTRASLLTGYYAQQVERDALNTSTHGGHGQRPSWAPLLPDLLRPYGYRSYHSGKWHIDGDPNSAGFVHSYLFEGWDRYFTPVKHYLNGKKLPTQTEEDGYYATTAIADYALDFLEQHQQRHPGQPFFQFLAFTAPHFPLRAPQEDIDRYRERYHAGWDRLRKQRWQRMRSIASLPGSLSALESEIGPPYDFPTAIATLGDGEVNREMPWNSLTTVQQEFQSTKMAIHAAMVHRLDAEVGRIIHYLRQQDELDNTVVLFLSDNGASAEIMIRGKGHSPDAPPGSEDSYLCLGPGWSRVSNTPFRRHKTWVHEGGIATPLIVHWPAKIKAKGEWRSSVGHVIDVVPTLLELAGVDLPAVFGGVSVPPKPGRSLVPTFTSNEPIKRDALWWLHEGNRAIRDGDWKLVAAKDEPWELYNLGKDRAENENLVDEFPTKAEELAKLWSDYERQIQQLVNEKAHPGAVNADRHARRPNAD